MFAKTKRMRHHLPYKRQSVDRIGARYDEIFVPPFEPWATSAANGIRVSGPDDLLGAAADDNGSSGGGGARSTVEEETAASAGVSWVKPPEISPVRQTDKCLLDFTPGGG